MTKIKMDNIEAASKNTSFLLSLAGIVVQWQKWHKIQATVMGGNGSLVACLLGYSIYYYRHDLDKLAAATYYFILAADASIATFITWNWRKDFTKTLNDSYWSYDYKSDLMAKEQKELQQGREKTIRTMYKYAALSCVFTLQNILLLSIVKTYINKDDIFLLFPCWFPFDVSSIPVHVLVIVWEQFLLTVITLLIHGDMCFMHLIYCYVKTEVSLLNFAMNHLRERTLEMAGNVEKIIGTKKDTGSPAPPWCYNACTKMCAQHHSYIISYFNGSATVTQALYMLTFFTGVILCAFSGFLIVSDNTALKIQFTLISIFQFIFLYVLCWVAEKISAESLSVRDTIYDMDWFTLPKECRSTMKIMMLRACNPLQMQVLHDQKVNLELYMTTVKASYSYINMMLTMTE